MDRPTFHAPLKPYHAAWLAGEITAIESSEAEYLEEIAYYTALLHRRCPPMAKASYRRRRALFYGKLRDLRKRRIH